MLESKKVNEEELRQALRNQIAKATPGVLRSNQMLNGPQPSTRRYLGDNGE